MIDVATMVEWIAISVPFLTIIGFVWAPKSWTPGELVTAATMNTNIRDHLNESLRTQATTSTGDQDDFALEGPFAYLKASNTSLLTITGALVDGGNIDGAKIIIESLVDIVTLNHQDAGSVAANRIITHDQHDMELMPFDRAQLIYDSTVSRWRAAHSSSGATDRSFLGPNLLGNPDFLIWPKGDADVPAYWAKISGDAAVARDTGEVVYGHFAVKLTWGTSATIVGQHIFTTGDFPGATWEGKHFSLVCRVKASTASQARIAVNDGVGASSFSDYHSGGGAFEPLKVTHEVQSSATKLRIDLHMDITGGVVFFDFPTAVEGLIIPNGPRPCTANEGTIGYTLAGDPVLTGASQWIYSNPRPFFINHVQVQTLSAVSATDLVIDVNHWDGSALQSMFGGTKIVLAQASSHQRQGKVPDGTYRYRCFAAAFGSARVADGELSIDVDTAPTGGKNPAILMRGIQYQRPYESLLDHDHVE